MAVVNPEDTLAIVISADPDSMASALALKRLFWRKLRQTTIYRINTIKRPDNLALVKLLKIDQLHIRYINRKKNNKWAIIDSQPQHNELFTPYPFDIIIDHHLAGYNETAQYVDIRDDIGATASMMTEYFQAANIVPSERLATALLYGIRTDTNNFIRHFAIEDINAFRYLIQLANMNVIKKIETSEITRKILRNYRFAIDHLKIRNDIAFVHMNQVKNPDNLVIIADFFMRLDEVTWSVVSGLFRQTLIIILRNSGLGNDAGQVAQKVFSKWGGSAGGHKEAARVELPVKKIDRTTKGRIDYAGFVRKQLASI